MRRQLWQGAKTIMKVTADTNVLVRCVVRDDPKQAAIAEDILNRAAVVAVTIPALCELVWVLRGTYGMTVADVVNALRVLTGARQVVTDLTAVEAGIALLENGGDFADGAIAFLGQRLGGEVFLSFDKQAVSLLNKHSQVDARLLG